MATRKSASSSTGAKRSTSRRTTARSSTRRATSSSTRRRSSGSLYPRRRASRPGLPTTVGTAIGTLVVTTLLDLSWPMRLLLIGVVLVLGLAYVLWRHRAEITAAASPDPATPEPASTEPPGPAQTASPDAPVPPQDPPPAPNAS